MMEDTNIRNGVYESLKNKSTGCIVVPFLLQVSRTEIDFLGLTSVPQEVDSLKCGRRAGQTSSGVLWSERNFGRFRRLDDRKFQTLVSNIKKHHLFHRVNEYLTQISHTG